MKNYEYYNSDKYAQLLQDLIDKYGASEACRALVYAGGNAGHRYTGLEDNINWKDPFESNLFSIAYNATDICNPKTGSALYNKIKRNLTDKQFQSLDEGAQATDTDRLYNVLNIKKQD